MPLDMLFDCFTWLLVVVQTKQKRSKAKEKDRLIKLWQYGNWTSNKLFMLVFSPIRRNGFFVGLGGKCPSPTKKFPHLLSLPNNTYFYFLFYFLSFIFHPPYFTSNQTQPQFLPHIYIFSNKCIKVSCNIINLSSSFCKSKNLIFFKAIYQYPLPHLSQKQIEKLGFFLDFEIYNFRFLSLDEKSIAAASIAQVHRVMFKYHMRQPLWLE